MTSRERWQRIEGILDDLFDLPREERAARLEALTGDDAGLRAEIEALLDADERTRGPLEESLETLAVEAVGGAETVAGVEVGRRIGPYRILDELGRGGMGQVLLAERADGEFDHRVALKIVQGGIDRDAIARRFQHERQILARLRHPNIAALYDGGTTDDGVPYFAMEVVEGERITDYADRNRLDIPARIELFESVCRAVQHAHRNLVIHRDIKPSNVLVTSDGAVKLLDFGIAKLVDADRPDATQMTGGFLTPAFAAPEQVTGDPVSTAADVFSLGVLLYVLLTGQHPHGDTSRSVEVARAVVEDDAPDPSTVVERDTTEATARETAAARGLDPAALKRRLRGDLDTIVTKALRRSPEDRYASPEDLRADLERHRRMLPVAARPATARYRLRRFAHRHRVGVTSAVLLGAALALGIGGVIWQAGVASRERDRARAEAERATAVKDYLVGIFDRVDPRFEAGETPTALELVERSARDVTAAFGEDPALRAEITQTLGSVLSRLAQYERADTLLTTALEAHRRFGRDERVRETLMELAENARWQGRLEDATALFEQALETSRALHGPRDPRTARALAGLGAVYEMQARWEDGRRVMREALAIMEDHDPLEYADHLSTLGSITGGLREFEEGERLYQEAYAVYEGIAPGGIASARVLASLADLLQTAGRMEEGEELARRGVSIMRREFGEDGHPELAIALNAVGSNLRAQNKLEEAMTFQLEAKAMFERHLGEDHIFVGRMMNNISATLNRQGRHEEAVEMLEEALRIAKLTLGDKHPTLLSSLCNLGNGHIGLGRLDEAEGFYREALDLARETVPAGGYDLSYPLVGLGSVYKDMDRLGEAEALLREGWEIRSAALGASNRRALSVELRVAEVVEGGGRLEDARAILDRAIANARQGVPESERILSDALAARARLGLRLQEPREAVRPLLREAYELRVTEYGEEDERTTSVLEELRRVS